MASLHLLEKSLLPEPVACQSYCLAPPPSPAHFPFILGWRFQKLGDNLVLSPAFAFSPLPFLPSLAEVWPLGLVLPGRAWGERAWRTGTGGD